MNLFPNPGSDILYLSSGENNLYFKLFNLNYKIVLKKRFNQDASINTTVLPSGIYFYEVMQGGKSLNKVNG